jgi:hypothetical protein
VKAQLATDHRARNGSSIFIASAMARAFKAAPFRVSMPALTGATA